MKDCSLIGCEKKKEKKSIKVDLKVFNTRGKKKESLTLNMMISR